MDWVGFKKSPFVVPSLMPLWLTVLAGSAIVKMLFAFHKVVSWVFTLFSLMVLVFFGVNLLMSHGEMWGFGQYPLSFGGGNLKAFFMFMFSEVFIFFGFFWGFFHSWADSGESLKLISGLTMPLVGSFLLFASAMTSYWFAAECTFNHLIVTMLLGVSFVGCQLLEYSTFLLNHEFGVFPSLFYSLTTLHGSHVIMGLIMLSFLLFFNLKKGKFKHAVMIYWHFVDYVWVFVYMVGYMILPL